MRSGRKPESRADKAKRLDFHDEVLAKGGCYWQQFIHHECHSVRDAMHWPFSKRFLKDHFFRLDPDDLSSLVYDPDNGVPGCRLAHGNIDSGHWTVYREWLADEAREFAGRNDLGWWIDAHLPSLNGDAA